MPGETKIIVRRSGALGDVVAATVVADKLHEQGYACEFQTHTNAHCLLKYQPSVASVAKPAGYAHVDLDGCYERNPARRDLHFYEMFLSRANEQLSPYGIHLGKPRNARPQLYPPDEVVEIARAKFSDYPRPWVFLVPRSNYYAPRQIPDPFWEAVAAHVQATCFWLGTHQAPEGIVDVQCRHVSQLVPWLSVADLVISVDTGPIHIAAALNRRILALGQSSSPELHLSEQCDFETLWPTGNLTCLNCQENKCPIDPYIPPCQKFDPIEVASTANQKLIWHRGSPFTFRGVSCVIPIFRPGVEMLNHCLQCVLPQVYEIVVTREAGGIVPEGVLRHEKIRHVCHRSSGLGFGRNVNFGLRHTSHEFVLILNDDVYLCPDAVERLKDEMAHDNVGMVGHLLRYPDGTIYHAGKQRLTNGGIGHPHLDLRKHLPTITEPVEMENTNGASILVRREAFYDIGGFDEEFLFFAEDDDLAMRMRQKGWRVWYTPKAAGFHEEHQETKALPNFSQIMNESNRRFARKWGPYFLHNRGNPGLGNFNYS
jgi:GT2 family glycosyltransferase